MNGWYYFAMYIFWLNYKLIDVYYVLIGVKIMRWIVVINIIQRYEFQWHHIVCPFIDIVAVICIILI